VIEADPERFAALRKGGGAAVVRDAGFTQVAPGTVTLMCRPPGPEPVARQRGLWARLIRR
jgi:peptidyl-tRNA hydrolase